MKKFKNNLENIFKLKKFNEEECKINLGIAVSVLNEIQNKIENNARKHHHAAAERYKDPFQIQVWDNYILRLESEAETLMEQAARAQIVVDEKKALYMEAFKELKAMEKLKEKKENEYYKEMEKKESIEIDEMYAARRLRGA
ncbi:MAG: flagellar export protein FliJ [Treponema sp.]|nr:flagellar export protein FliJ [Treponema sp.]